MATGDIYLLRYRWHFSHGFESDSAFVYNELILFAAWREKFRFSNGMELATMPPWQEIQLESYSR